MTVGNNELFVAHLATDEAHDIGIRNSPNPVEHTVFVSYLDVSFAILWQSRANFPTAAIDHE